MRGVTGGKRRLPEMRRLAGIGNIARFKAPPEGAALICDLLDIGLSGSSASMKSCERSRKRREDHSAGTLMLDADIRNRLELARRELLDLSLRNTLLNYRLPKARGVEIVGTSGGDVFHWLVTEGRELTFAPALPNDEPQQGDLPKRKSSVSLQTAHEETNLRSRLLNTYYTARTHIEERGVNVLFIAVGMLHWFEDESSERELKAPLLLIPVELQRKSAREQFTVRYDEEDIEENLSLAEKLKHDFWIEYPKIPEAEDLDVHRYFAAIERAIAGQKRWRVEPDEIALGFFSFSKFLMYRDLQPESWGSGEHARGSSLLAALLRDGFRNDTPAVAEEEYLDKFMAPTVLRQVKDADSSQVLAMLDVRAGRNLVIQGPPGTGKSQTITNLIADAIGQGKRVLFVAEKMAALEVVKRRLDKVELGDACLELHSHAANKKNVLNELKRTLQLGRPRLESVRWSLEQYKRARDQLNAYCLALNTPLENSGWTPQQLLGELLAVDRVRGNRELPKPPFESLPDTSVAADIARWDRETLEAKQEIVAQLEAHLGRMGVPASHPFRDSRLEVVLPSDLEAIAAALRSGIEALRTLDAASRDLAGFMGITARADRNDASVLVRAARRALSAPHLAGVELRTREWAEKRDELNQLFDAGERHSALHEKYDAVLIPEAWEQDLLEAREVLNTIGRKWWRWLSSDYRRVRRRVAGLCRGEHARDTTTQLELVDAILEAARLVRVVKEYESLAGRLFGVQWQGLRSEWAILRRLTDWIIELYRDIGDGRLPHGIVDFLAGAPALDALKGKVEALEAALPVYDQTIPTLFDRTAIESAARDRLISAPLPEQIACFETMLERLADLPDIITFNNLRTALSREGIAWVIDAAWDWSAAAQLLVPFFRRTVLELLLRRAYAEREALRTADGVTLTRTRDTFRQLDVMSLSVTRLELAKLHYEGLPRLNGQGQVGVLLREFEKRSRHLPIRKLMSQAGNAIQAIKPVFMMSPMSIAAFIPPGAVQFDLVIFDEASQVKPVDAFGAVLRGSQLVVVGDSKQLPPTSFFDALLGVDDPADDEEGDNVAADMESILSLAVARGMPQRMLRWHYRSRHHSLISLSNREFYDNRLVVFPSPEPPGRALGLTFHHLPDARYDRGRSRTNPLEAKVVAQAVMTHAKTTPHLTLGVAAFSIQQADAIKDQLELMRRADPSAEAFFSAHPHEPFFVKNLESVQGDERDVIFISVGYGRSEEGYLSMNFGALNAQGGERRLNVLITRARRRCEVFSNLTHEDIDLTRTSARGVAVLKAFLKYAQTGIDDVPTSGTEEGDSPFEDEVAKALRSQGHDVVAQVGSGGFRIDLAVRDPERPGRYLLGIECDGATYHASRSARDRDRLRQQVLEDLGWTIHRIWSTDWFRNPRRELERVLAAIEQAKIRAGQTVHEATLPSPPAESESTPLRRAPAAALPAIEPLKAEPYRTCTLQIRLGGVALHEVPPSRFADWIEQVVRVEAPVHKDEVVRRIAAAAGVMRVGSRIAAAFEAGVRAAEQTARIRRRGDFLWMPDNRKVRPRDRSRLDAASRGFELISREEIAAAIIHVVGASHGMDPEEIPQATCRYLGFARTSDDMADVVKRIVLKLVEMERLRMANGHVTPGAAQH